MSRTPWADIKADYVTTAMTLADAQTKWGVKRGTLSARATREGWNDAKQQFAADLEQQRRQKILAKRESRLLYRFDYVSEFIIWNGM